MVEVFVAMSVPYEVGNADGSPQKFVRRWASWSLQCCRLKCLSCAHESQAKVSGQRGDAMEPHEPSPQHPKTKLNTTTS
eukprot:5482126-Amphidinium_carterae.1